MNATTVRAQLVRVLATLALAVFTAPSSARALACVVGTGAGTCTDAALNACLPGGGSFTGTVTFNCGGAATITVTSTKAISADTTIDGGSLITISGGGSVGVFSVNAGVTFTVQNLTIANGSNSATGYGGGIYSQGTLTVTNSTFSGNSSASYGGGIYSNGGTLTVTNNTFSGNSAGIYGGGIYGGGLTATVTNSTFSGNSAPYGGGAIFGNSPLTTVTNTILANSTSGGNCGGSVPDGGHNIEDLRSCFNNGTGCTNPIGSSFCNTNPLLASAGLASNGGPTQTIALQASSPAINAGDESVCSTTTGVAPVDYRDQRGFVRPGTGATNCSIGAFEANSAAPPPPCVGDCNANGQVTVDEILTMVNIALGNTVTACDAGDANHDAQITVDEILTAVNNALNGCGG
jgi:predicted outer membrane repeat protein